MNSLKRLVLYLSGICFHDFKYYWSNLYFNVYSIIDRAKIIKKIAVPTEHRECMICGKIEYKVKPTKKWIVK